MRNKQTTGALLGSLLLLGGCAAPDKNNNLFDYTTTDNAEKVGKLLARNNSNSPESIQDFYDHPEIIKSIKIIGKQEFSLFLYAIGISPGVNGYKKYKEALTNIQILNGLTEDYIIGPVTLKILYTDIYPSLNRLPKTIHERLTIFNELNKLYAGTAKVGLGKPWSSRHYSKELPNHNIVYLESGLEQYIEKPDNNGKIIKNQELGKKNSIIIRLIGGQQRFLYYDTNGGLMFASTTTTGGVHKDGGIKTPKWKGIPVSGYLKKDKTSDKYKDAVMPYAVHITNGIWVHGRAVSGKDTSHGCIGLPYNAARKFYFIAENQNVLVERLKDKGNHDNIRIFVEDN